MTRSTVGVGVFAGLVAATVTLAILRAFLEYQGFDDGFDDIICDEYGIDPASWPRAIRYPS